MSVSENAGTFIHGVSKNPKPAAIESTASNRQRPADRNLRGLNQKYWPAQVIAKIDEKNNIQVTKPTPYSFVNASSKHTHALEVTDAQKNAHK